MFSQTYFDTDTRGRLYSTRDAVQLQMLGVDRIYQGFVRNPYRTDTARLIGGQYYIPEEAIRRPGIIYISRCSLESVLWHVRYSADQLTQARTQLLCRLRFETQLPCKVYLDPLRRLYIFATIASESTDSTLADLDAPPGKVPLL